MQRIKVIGLSEKSARIIDKLMCVLLLIPFLEPKGLTMFLKLSDGWEYIVIIDCAILLLLRLFIMHSARKIYLLFGLFYASITISTFLNGRELQPAFYYAAIMICFVVVIDYFSERHELYFLLRSIKVIVGIYIIFNLIFQLFDQSFFGYTASYNYRNFLESDNFLGYWYISFMLVVYLETSFKSRRRRQAEMIFWSVICFISLVKAWAATCLSIFTLFLIIYFVFRKTKILSFLTPFRVLIINIVLSAAIVIFRLQYLFEYLIVDVLGKSLTLSNRIYVWDAAILNILKNPILGYGTVQGGRLSINYSSIINRTYFSHNIFLEITIQGGIVALILFAAIYYFAGKGKAFQKNSDTKTVMMIALFCILLMQFSEFDIYEPFVNLPLILCFFYDRVNEQLTPDNLTKPAPAKYGG